MVFLTMNYPLPEYANTVEWLKAKKHSIAKIQESISDTQAFSQSIGYMKYSNLVRPDIFSLFFRKAKPYTGSDSTEVRPLGLPEQWTFNDILLFLRRLFHFVLTNERVFYASLV